MAAAVNRQAAVKGITANKAAQRGRRGRPSASEAETRKRAVFGAARAEFIAHGYHAATMEGIAARAGVSKRTLYIWHADKAALFRACIVEGANEIALPAFDHEETLDISLFRFTVAVMLAVTTDEALKLVALMTREGSASPELYEAIERGRSVMIDPISDALLDHGVAPRHAVRIARFFLSTAFSNFNDRITFGLRPMNRKEIEEDVRYAIDIFIRGIGSFSALPDADPVAAPSG